MTGSQVHSTSSSSTPKFAVYYGLLTAVLAVTVVWLTTFILAIGGDCVYKCPITVYGGAKHGKRCEAYCLYNPMTPSPTLAPTPSPTEVGTPSTSPTQAPLINDTNWTAVPTTVPTFSPTGIAVGSDDCIFRDEVIALGPEVAYAHMCFYCDVGLTNRQHELVFQPALNMESEEDFVVADQCSGRDVTYPDWRGPAGQPPERWSGGYSGDSSMCYSVTPRFRLRWAVLPALVAIDGLVILQLCLVFFYTTAKCLFCKIRDTEFSKLPRAHKWIGGALKNTLVWARWLSFAQTVVLFAYAIIIPFRVCEHAKNEKSGNADFWYNTVILVSQSIVFFCFSIFESLSLSLSRSRQLRSRDVLSKCTDVLSRKCSLSFSHSLSLSFSL